MNQRERQAPGGMAAAVLGRPTPVESAPRLGPTGEVSSRRDPLWENVFPQTSPSQQAELLALAARQGLLYAHQLPKTNSRPRATGQPENNQRHHLLVQLLAGQTGDLQPLRAPAVTLHDTALDASQAEAVARALATPDVCLIQGLPGTGKSRVVAEIIRQAAQRGERILFLAATTAALDCALQQLGPLDCLLALRLLNPRENPAELSPLVRSCLLSERLRALHEEMLPKARQTLTQAEATYQRRQHEEALWPRLEDLANRLVALQQQLLPLQQQRLAIPGEVAQEATAMATAHAPPTNAGFQLNLFQRHHEHRQALVALAAMDQQANDEQANTRRELAFLHDKVAALQPLAIAKSEGRWWSLTWWRATCQPAWLRQLAELQGRIAQAENALHLAEQQTQQRQEQRQQLEQQMGDDLARALEAECQQRLAVITQQEESLRGQEKELTAQWQQLTDELIGEELRPTAMHPQAVAQARQQWCRQKQQDGEACQFAHQWTSFLEGSVGLLGDRLPWFSNLVAATFAGLGQDTLFTDGAAPSFDLLILEEAEQLSEAECLKAAQWATRWIMVGEPTWTEGRWTRPTVADRPAYPSRGPSRHAVFQRLWDYLHCDPGRLPYSWGWEGERLCCRLRPLSPEQRPWLESERLADAPAIELRILALPRARPVLAEVLFPGTMSVPEAKEFIFRELQELPIQPAGRSWCWLEDGEYYILRLAESPLRQATPVSVEPGVREWVGALAEPMAAPIPATKKPAAWFTCRLEFAKGDGWHRDQVHAWVHSHLPLPDLGRTISLQIPYRMRVELSEVLSDLLFQGTYVVPRACGPSEAGRAENHAGLACSTGAVEFVAVPPLRKENGHKPDARHKRNAAPKQSAGRLPQEGAGLELDLTMTRPGDRLPADLRGDLPARGFVNLPEAQAVVRKLETLVKDPAVQSLCHGSEPVIAVLALYAAQVELIHRLIKRSAVLNASTVPFVVGQPRAFRHREFPVVLLSLTRSHAHRPVSYGEQAAEVALGMTRARTQLILFGDPGSLVRRSRWQGGLEPLDDLTAAREGQLVGDLVRYLQGQGRHSRAFLLCESNCP